MICYYNEDKLLNLNEKNNNLKNKVWKFTHIYILLKRKCNKILVTFKCIVLLEDEMLC